MQILNRRPSAALRAGFSLIELVITMSILMIIAGVAVPQFSNFQQRAQDSRRIADLVAVEKALDAYFADHGEYPSTGGGWWGEAPNRGARGYDANGYIPGLVPDYIKELPRDPNPGLSGDAGYLYRSGGGNYKFLAHNTPSEFPTDHRFRDPRRPNGSYMVSTPNAVNW